MSDLAAEGITHRMHFTTQCNLNSRTIHRAKLIIILFNVSFLQLWRDSLHGRNAKRFPARIVRDPVVLVPARG